MTITSEFLREDAISYPVIKMAVNGQVGIPDLIAEYEQMLDSECFRRNMNVIWDLTNIDIAKVVLDDLRKLPMLLREYEQRRGQAYKVRW